MAVVGLGLRLRRMGLRRVGLWLRLRSLSSTTALTTAARPVAIGPWLGLHSPPYRPGLLFSGLLFSAIVTVNSEPSRTWLSLAVGTECMSGTPRYSLRVLVYTLSSRVGPLNTYYTIKYTVGTTVLKNATRGTFKYTPRTESGTASTV